MKLRNATTKNVNPMVAAAAILGVLGAVQYYWWVGLVRKTPMPPVRPGGPGLTRMETVQNLQGMANATVDTVSGSADPGFLDGLGRDARFDSPGGLALDRQGNVLVADTRNNRIRMVASTGDTDTLSGGEHGFLDGPKASALFNAPTGVACAPDGAIFVADTLNHRVRRIANGVVTTIAGSVAGMVDGPGATAKFNLPTGIAWVSGTGVTGTIAIADSGNRRIRVIRLGTGGANVETVRVIDGVPTGIAAQNGAIAVTVPDKGVIWIGASSQTAPTVLPRTAEEGAGPGKTVIAQPIAICSAVGGWYVAGMDNASVLKYDGKTAHVIAGSSLSKGISIAYRDGPADKAGFGMVSAVVSDGGKHIYVADATHNCIRRIILP